MTTSSTNRGVAAGGFVVAWVTLLGRLAVADERPLVVVGDEARRIHAQSFVFDGHNDLPWKVRSTGAGRLEAVDLAAGVAGFATDIPRLRQGNVDAQFWSVYVPVEMGRQGLALQTTIEQIELVRELVSRYPETFAVALDAADVDRIRAEGRIASLIAVEGGHCIEDSLANLRRLFDLGARSMTLTHADTLSWADAATDDPEHGGLTDFGVEVVREMNRLGMLVDLSHVSPDTMRAALRVSTAPVVFTHSSARAIADHPRNVPDDVLKLVAANGGVVMVNFYSGFVHPESGRRRAALLPVARRRRGAGPTCSRCRGGCGWSIPTMLPTGPPSGAGRPSTPSPVDPCKTSSITSTTSSRSRASTTWGSVRTSTAWARCRGSSTTSRPTP
jgi:membrane dipeptidase